MNGIEQPCLHCGKGSYTWSLNLDMACESEAVLCGPWHKEAVDDLAFLRRKALLIVDLLDYVAPPRPRCRKGVVVFGIKYYANVAAAQRDVGPLFAATLASPASN
tara:strand:- start:3556 stop:3870 length:315 start_codon:yes stop_codon:yes gene_type:complete